MSNVIVVSAHPDDEVLGAGGTLLKHVAKGDQVHWLIITNVLEEYGFSAERVKSRQEEIVEVATKMGFTSTIKLDYPTMLLHPGMIIDMVPKISDVFHQVKPETIYVMNRSDAHSDHRVIFDAVVACTKSFRYPFIRKVLMYECLSETEFAPALPERVFMPNYYVDISEYLEKKLEVMEIYESELGPHPFPRSLDNIRALAHFRGASVGTHYAEAFQLIKFIDKQ
ncbi:PIG-L deacetylase family protein [Chitinophaga sp.]|uniref:PIG-L deacetylase family protein n=1 Tax=Chitinophaga sp. TaxID=1869181 RepID=UPI002F938E5D